MSALQKILRDMDGVVFKNRGTRWLLTNRISMMRRHLKKGQERPVARQLDKLVDKVDGCVNAGRVDRNDWLRTCNEQKTVYWAVHELNVPLATKN